jgi:hypothetical protein
MRVDIFPVQRAHLQQEAVKREGPDIDTGVGAGKAARRCAPIFKCFPSNLEQQPLLRIDVDCFAWRNAEEGSVEPIQGFAEKSTLADICLPDPAGIRAVESVQVPAACWNVTDSIIA